MSGTECYSSVHSTWMLTAWHSSSRQGREISTANLWRRNGDAKLKNTTYPGWGWEIITAFFPSIHLHPCLTALLSQCLVPLCYGCRRLTPRMLHCIGTSGSCEQSICLHPAVICRCVWQLLHHLAAGIQ